MHVLSASICISLMFLSLCISTPQGKLEAASVTSLQPLCFVVEEAKGSDNPAVIQEEAVSRELRNLSLQ